MAKIRHFGNSSRRTVKRGNNQDVVDLQVTVDYATLVKGHQPSCNISSNNLLRFETPFCLFQVVPQGAFPSKLHRYERQESLFLKYPAVSQQANNVRMMGKRGVVHNPDFSQYCLQASLKRGPVGVDHVFVESDTLDSNDIAIEFTLTDRKRLSYTHRPDLFYAVGWELLELHALNRGEQTSQILNHACIEVFAEA